jgi:outer membrane lipoprotein-sorting protein
VKIARLAQLVSFSLPLCLAGCSWLPSTRRLPVPKAPANVQTLTPEELVARLNDRWNALQSLNAKVSVKASVDKPKEGIEHSYTTFPAIILLRKPQMLRVLGQLPLLNTRMFDMASDGKNFKLYIPSKNEAVEGPASLNKKSADQIENMRPGFFFDAMVVRGVEPDDFYAVTADSETVEDPSKKHLLLKSEYVLSIMRQEPGTHQNITQRVVIFDRTTLLPYEQDIYDVDGNLETKVLYSNYGDFDSINFPSTITIERPQEQYHIVLTVLTVTENQTLKDDQFEVKLPADTQIKTLR